MLGHSGLTEIIESALRETSLGALSRFMEVSNLENVKAVSLNEQVRFRCQLCGGCCHYVKDSIMLEPMDIYRLARYLREQGELVTGTEDVLAEYAHASWLEGNYPIFVLNTESELDVCTFLKDGRCRVYEARPHVCRMYPFSAAPGSRGRDFQYLLCTEKPHHFADGIVTVKDWLSQNFSKETKAILKADYNALPVIGQNIRAMSVEQFKKLAFQFIYYRYYNYELDAPFLPQFLSNREKLKELPGGRHMKE